ncbi:MAG: PepSY-associated TM helix domain-containing protein [Vicinamibacterales bacterium]
MGSIRKVLFWLHLSAGVVAGVVILMMSVTGVALTYERQMNEWAVRHLRSTPPTLAAEPLPPERLLQRVQQDHPGIVPTGLTIGSAPDAAVMVAAERTPLFVDAYTGQTLGERPSGGLRAFLSEMRAWHRWLAVEGEGRPVARAITGWSNLLFLFIVVSGVWIWVPRVWCWAQVRSVMLFRREYGTSKARDFNWHNVIGIWSAIPLFIVVISAVPISFPWAGDLVYRAVGEEPPARNRPGGPPGRAGGPREPGRRGGSGETAAGGGRRASRAADAAPRTPRFDGLDGLMARAAADQPGWRTITVRFPRRGSDPFVFNIDHGDGGQPQLRSSLSLDRQGAVVARETFADQSLGRRIRSVMRFAHTGEVLGLAGQTFAGLASAGAVVLVWTGLALSWRRFRAWVSLPRTAVEPSASGLKSPAREPRWAGAHASLVVSGFDTPPSQE